MEIFNGKKGIVTHPVTMFVIALVLGLILAYVWINYVNIPNPFCPKFIFYNSIAKVAIIKKTPSIIKIML